MSRSRPCRGTEEVLLQFAEALGVGFDEDLVALAQFMAQGDAAQVVEVAAQQVGSLTVEQVTVLGAAMAFGVTASASRVVPGASGTRASRRLPARWVSAQPP
jgi:hypothetical protein